MTTHYIVDHCKEIDVLRIIKHFESWYVCSQIIPLGEVFDPQQSILNIMSNVALCLTTPALITTNTT